MEVPNKCPLELVEVESEDKDGGAGRVEGERGLEAADHEDPVAVAANESGALEDVEDVPPFMALEARPRRRRSCGDDAGEKFPPATACGDGGRSSAVAAHRGCKASRGGGRWLEQQVVERKREREEKCTAGKKRGFVNFEP